MTFHLRSLVLAALVTLGACSSVEPVRPALPRAYPEGERIFHGDPRWLGGDAAVSIALSDDRVLWLFGDSFVDASPPYHRSEAGFVRNSAAIQAGADPRFAHMQFLWRTDRDGALGSFIPEDDKDWFWPMGGLRLPDGALAIFLQRVSPTKAAPPLGFAVKGFALLVVDNPDEPVAAWRMRRFDGPHGAAIPGAGVLRDGAYAIALALRSDIAQDGSIVRYRLDELARGELGRAEWWMGAKRGWVAADALGDEEPAVAIGGLGTESSLQRDTCGRGAVQVSSRGFGASDVVMRTAKQPAGPWRAPVTAYHPPESDLPAPFVYAAKAHAELATPGEGELIVSYVASSLTPDALLTAEGERDLYWPRLALVAAPPC